MAHKSLVGVSGSKLSTCFYSDKKRIKVLTLIGLIPRMRPTSDADANQVWRKSGGPGSPSSSGLGHRPFTAVTGVRVP
jgi:hypothetical protein